MDDSPKDYLIDADDSGNKPDQAQDINNKKYVLRASRDKFTWELDTDLKQKQLKVASVDDQVQRS